MRKYATMSLVSVMEVKKMDVKLLAMDLDGTLMLGDHQHVGETTRRVLAACRQKGVRLALATGRTLALTEPVQAQLPFLDYVVFSNGAGVWDIQNKRLLHSDPMDLADARQICAYLDSRPVYYEFYADGVPVAPARCEGLARLDGVPDSFVDELLEKVVYRDSVADALAGMTVEKLNLFTIPDAENRALRDFLHTMDRVEITSSIGCNVEAGKVGTSKATALAALCGQLRMQPDQVMCFGDSGNDVDMLRYCGHSYAMENGTAAAKAAARFLAPSNDREGLAQVAQRVIVEENADE